MARYRTALADYLTIFTGLSTLLGGIYSVYAGHGFADQTAGSDYWGVFISHAVAIAVTMISFYFFFDQSIHQAKRIIDSGKSAMPSWLVHGFFYFGGISIFCVFQIMLQSSLFESFMMVYMIVPVSIWVLVTIPLVIVSLLPKKQAR